jgi:hypothetical protein
MEVFYGKHHLLALSNGDCELLLIGCLHVASPTSEVEKKVCRFLESCLDKNNFGYGCRSFSFNPPPPPLYQQEAMRYLAQLITSFARCVENNTGLRHLGTWQGTRKVRWLAILQTAYQLAGERLDLPVLEFELTLLDRFGYESQLLMHEHSYYIFMPEAPYEEECELIARMIFHLENPPIGVQVDNANLRNIYLELATRLETQGQTEAAQHYFEHALQLTDGTAEQ